MEGKCEHCGYDPDHEQVIRVTISDEELPAYGAYLSPSARQGKAQVVLDFALHFATAKNLNEDFVSVLSVSAAHELGHALQDLLGRAFSESDVEMIAQASQGVEVADLDDSTFREEMAEGMRMGQELFQALEGLVIFYEFNGGNLDTAQYLNAKAAIAKARGEG